MENYTPTEYISKIFEIANSKSLESEKVEFLRKYDLPAVREIIRHAFDPEIEYRVSETIDYKPLGDLWIEPGLTYSAIRKSLPMMFHETLDETKRTKIFQAILETIAPEDAKLLLSVRHKKWPYKELTPVVLEKAFPGTLSLEQIAARTELSDVTKTVLENSAEPPKVSEDKSPPPKAKGKTPSKSKKT